MRHETYELDVDMVEFVELGLDCKLRILKFVFEVEYDFDSNMRLEPTSKMNVGLKS